MLYPYCLLRAIKNADRGLMSQALRRFIHRAPRYVLRTGDNQMLRFAPQRGLNRTYSTQFVNVSESGIAFIVDPRSAPRLREVIKLEFTVPGGEQIAWFGRVVRLEEFHNSRWWSSKSDGSDDREILVAIHFHDLPQGHLNAIRMHLQGKFRQVAHDWKMARMRRAKSFLKEHAWQLVIYFAATVVTAGILFLLSRPSPNYDAQKGAPWGQRFKFFGD
jgi:hypothetical protein